MNTIGPAWLFILPAAVALLGVLLLIRGLRGRLIHTRPTCRRCRFDLSGVVHQTAAPAAIDATSLNPTRPCPECGADLAAPAAIRPGLRARRPLSAAAGAMLLFIALAGFGLVAASRSNVRLIALKPNWLLAVESRSPDQVRATAALAELVSRQSAGKLSAPQLAALAGVGLKRQADPDTPWIPQWGTLVSRARAAGLVSDQDFGQFLKNGIELSIVSRGRVHKGGRHTISLKAAGVRLGETALVARITGRSLTLGPATIADPNRSDRFGISDSGTVMAGRVVAFEASVGPNTDRDATALPATADLPLGPHPLRYAVTVAFEETDRKAPNGSWIGAETSAAEPFFTFDTVLETDVTVVAPDQPLVEGVPPSQALTDALLRAVRVNTLALVPAPIGHNPMVEYSITAANAPAPLACEVVLRWTNARGTAREDVIGSVVFAKHAGMSSFGGGGQIPGFDADTADLILRPSLKVAELSEASERYYLGELLFPAQRINRPARPPTSDELQQQGDDQFAPITDTPTEPVTTRTGPSRPPPKR